MWGHLRKYLQTGPSVHMRARLLLLAREGRRAVCVFSPSSFQPTADGSSALWAPRSAVFGITLPFLLVQDGGGPPR